MPRIALSDSPTKARLLNAAQALMLAKGFAATTVDDICGKAQLTKGSFFHYFRSKDELGKQLLERFCAQGERLHASFCREETDPLKRVYGYIDGTIALAKDPVMSNGCLLGLFAQELCDTHPAIRTACCKGFDEWAEAFRREVAKAKAAYAPRAAFHPREVAEYFIAVLEGSMILGKAHRDTAIMVKNLGHFKAYLKSLFGR